jgi:hypothetical protein
MRGTWGRVVQQYPFWDTPPPQSANGQATVCLFRTQLKPAPPFFYGSVLAVSKLGRVYFILSETESDDFLYRIYFALPGSSYDVN